MISVLATFTWNYNDLFVILVSTALALRFKQIAERLAEYEKKVNVYVPKRRIFFIDEMDKNLNQNLLHYNYYHILYFTFTILPIRSLHTFLASIIDTCSCCLQYSKEKSGIMSISLIGLLSPATNLTLKQLISAVQFHFLHAQIMSQSKSTISIPPIVT